MKKGLITVIVCTFSIYWYSVPISIVHALETQIKQSEQRVEHISDNSGTFQVQAQAMNHFPGIMGPTDSTPIPVLKETTWEKYQSGSTSRLAILLTDTKSAWLPLAHGLKSVGIPFVITTDYKTALEHKVVMVYPSLSGKVISQENSSKLRRFTMDGGTLIGVTVDSMMLKDVFGFSSVVSSAKHNSMRLQDKKSALLAMFKDEREIVLALGSQTLPPPYIGVNSYINIGETPLAVFEDGSAAITQKKYGKGTAYAWGVDIGHLLRQCFSGRAEGISRSYINEFEPTVDVMLSLLKAMYENGNKDSVTIGTVPYNKALTVMLTHDVDYGESEKNALSYAEFEKEHQVRATYFLQTKYIKDYNDGAFFDVNVIPLLKKLTEMGMEIGSHSVSHAYAFNVFPVGTGEERYPSYQPFVAERYKAYNGTIFGELRVSKYLLEEMLGALPVVSFRPGHLSYPFSLPEAMEAAGYLYSSVFPANVVMSHLPFQTTYQYDVKGETNVFEFPVTLEDELGVKMGERVQPALNLAHKIAKYGGIYVILIHPNILEHKLQFEKEFILGVKDFAWFSTIKDFGKWWAARDKVAVDVLQEGTLRIVKVTAAEPLQGLTLKVPEGWVLSESNSDNFSQKANRIIINKLAGSMRLVFAIQ